MSALLGGISAIVTVTVLMQKEVTGVIKQHHVSDYDILMSICVYTINEDGESENQSISVEGLSSGPCGGIRTTIETEQIITTISTISGMYIPLIIIISLDKKYLCTLRMPIDIMLGCFLQKRSKSAV